MRRRKEDALIFVQDNRYRARARMSNTTILSLCMIIMVVSANKPAATKSRNILIVDSFLGGSHYQFLSLLGNELAGHGHDVTILLPDCSWNTTDKAKYEGKIKYTPFTSGVTEQMRLDMMAFFAARALLGELSSITWFAKLWLGVLKDPEAVAIMNLTDHTSKVFLRDKELHASLKSSQYDLVICDIISPMCTILAHDILELPYVNIANGGPLGTRYTRWMNVPSPLSYVPEYLTHFTDLMPFGQRVTNALMHAFSLFVYDFGTLSTFDSIRRKCGLNEAGIPMREVLSNSSLFVLNWDFVLEYPRPVQPNFILAGGVSVQPSKALSSDFEEFVQGSGEAGVAVFSVSTLVNLMDAKMADMIAGALARLPMRVVWKFKGQRKPATLGNNTMLASWLPQGDLLGHTKTKVFIFHGGINGAYEAIYHGVPVVGIPLFADQIDDLLRLRSLGMAEFEPLGIRGLTTDSLYKMIMKVSSEPRYKRHALEASARFQAQPGEPLEKAAFWINHVLEHGAIHLRSGEGGLSWYQNNLLDVAGALVAACLTSLWVLRLCLSTLSTKFSGARRK